MATLTDRVATHIAELTAEKGRLAKQAALNAAAVDEQLALLARAAKLIDNPEVEAVYALLVKAGLIQPIQ